VKKFLVLFVALGLGAVFAACNVAEEEPLPWQEQYWQAYWERGHRAPCDHGCCGSHTTVSFIDLNDDGVLEMITVGWSDGMPHSAAIATIVNDKAQFFTQHEGGMGLPLRGHRHKETGELRYFNIGEWNEQFQPGNLSEVVLDWDGYTMSAPQWLAYQWHVIDEDINRYVMIDGEYLYEYYIDGRQVDKEEHEAFFARFHEQWEQVPGLELGIPGGRAINGNTYDVVRESFFAALRYWMK